MGLEDSVTVRSGIFYRLPPNDVQAAMTPWELPWSMIIACSAVAGCVFLFTMSLVLFKYRDRASKKKMSAIALKRRRSAIEATQEELLSADALDGNAVWDEDHINIDGRAAGTVPAVPQGNSRQQPLGRGAPGPSILRKTASGATHTTQRTNSTDSTELSERANS